MVNLLGHCFLNPGPYVEATLLPLDDRENSPATLGKKHAKSVSM